MSGLRYATCRATLASHDEHPASAILHQRHRMGADSDRITL
jgi:hypothetical protein